MAYEGILETNIVKKLQSIVFIVVVSFSGLTFAAGAPLFGGPAPVQSYESAGSPQNSNNRHTAADSRGVDAKVAEIMAQSKAAVELGKVKPVTQVKTITSTVATPKKFTLKSAVGSEVASELESQMNELNQATLLYQQQTSQKIKDLSSQNVAIQSRLKKLTQAMLMLNQQLSTMDSSSSKTSASLPKTLKKLSHSISFEGVFSSLAFVLAALLAVMLGVLISRQKKQSSQ